MSGAFERGLAIVLLCVAACGSESTPSVSAASAADDSLKKTKVAITVSPTTATVGVGQTMQFAAAVTGTTNAAVHWTATGGTIDTQGLFTAGTQPGAFKITATSAAAKTTKATASVTVTSVAAPHAFKYVFVVALENQDANTIYGNSHAPYLNDTLMKNYAYANNYRDDLPTLPSEPHYVFMEAGTNVFADATFTTDNDPSVANSTASTAHIVSQGLTSWTSYQEDMPTACPVASAFPYAAKHNPFVFFRDVSFTNGEPDPSNAYCAAHHKDFTHFAADLADRKVATYNFITPNLCNDMHGDSRCTNGCTSLTVGSAGCVSAGDTWLATNLPPLIAFANANQGVIFIVWDEAEKTTTAPFFVIGPHLKAPGTGNAILYGHGSLARSIEEVAGLPLLPTVESVNDFSDFFEAGAFP